MNTTVNIYLKEDLRGNHSQAVKTASEIAFYIAMGSSSIVDGVAFLSRKTVSFYESWIREWGVVNVSFLNEKEFSDIYMDISKSYDPYFASITIGEFNQPRIFGIGHLAGTTLVQGPNNMRILSENLEYIHNKMNDISDSKRSVIVYNKKSGFSTATTAANAAQATIFSTLNDFQLDNENTMTLDMNLHKGSYPKQQKNRETYSTEHFDRLLETVKNLQIPFAIDQESTCIHISPIDLHTLNYIRKFLSED